MQQRFWTGGLAVLALLIAVGTVTAREPGLRTEGQKSTGARTDITVPYLNNGGTTSLGNGVAPLILASPTVDNPPNPGVVPVYNLPFYGAVQGFGSASVGAMPRQTPFKQ